MRHLWSFLLSLVLIPFIYVAAGFSAVKFATAAALGVDAFLGLTAALAAGGLYAVLVMARLSPVGPVFAGLVYLGVTIWAVVDRASFASTIPADLFGQKDLLHVPVGFGTALLAAPLLFTIFSPRRWRRSAQVAPAAFEAAPYVPAPATPAASSDLDTTLSSTPSFGGLPTYEPPVYTPPTHPLATPAPEPAGTDSERTGLM